MTIEKIPGKKTLKVWLEFLNMGHHPTDMKFPL